MLMALRSIPIAEQHYRNDSSHFFEVQFITFYFIIVMKRMLICNSHWWINQLGGLLDQLVIAIFKVHLAIVLTMSSFGWEVKLCPIEAYY